MKPTLAALALVGLVSAQETTTNLFLVGFTSQSIVGSIITSDATATTYSLQCGDSDNCGGPGGIPETGLLFTQGPSTMTYSYLLDETVATETIELGCTFANSLTGTCSGTGAAVIASATTTITGSTTTFTDGGSALGGQDVTLTGGALPTNSAAPSTTVSTTSTSGSATKTGKTTSTSSGASATTNGSNSSSSSSKAAAPMITQAPWLVGGAAAALAYAVL